MRKTIILALLSSMLISCATIQSLVGESSEQQSPEAASLDGSLPQTSPDLTAPAASADQAYTSNEMGDSSQAPAEVQAAEQQTAHAEAMNEQRSTSELDAAAPEGSGTDSFYASTATPGMPQPETPPEVEQVTPDTASQLPTELPEKGASWDQAAANTTPETSYEEQQPEEKPVFKKSSKSSKKHIAKKSKKQNKIAKKDKKSKKHIAKQSKKSKKQIAKKGKYDCKKIAKNSKKASKREIASCKAEIRKIASVKSKKMGKLAKAGCQCNVR